MSENQITLQIEGVPAENGDIRVSDFIERIEHLLTTLNGIDRMVGQTNQPTLYYRIVDAHHSKLTLTIEPVLRKRIVTPEVDHIKKRNARFFHEMKAIQRGEPVSPDVDDALLENFRALVEGLGQTYAAAKISNGSAAVELDAAFEHNVRQLLDEEDASYGSEEGMLEALNIHGRTRTCWIYPRIGPQKIRCDFLPGTKEQIREVAGQHVRVEGLKYFRHNSPFPFRMAVKEFEAISEGDATYLKDMGGVSPSATGDLSSVEFVRKIRDEWD